jgi:hypothetical protein
MLDQTSGRVARWLPWTVHRREALGVQHLDRARAAFADGADRKAARLAWRAANDAVRRDDRAALEAARSLAVTLGPSPDPKAASEAERLLAFCDACRANPDTLRSPTAFGRLIERDTKHG